MSRRIKWTEDLLAALAEAGIEVNGSGEETICQRLHVADGVDKLELTVYDGGAWRYGIIRVVRRPGRRRAIRTPLAMTNDAQAVVAFLKVELARREVSA